MATERHWSAPAFGRTPLFQFKLEPNISLLTVTRTGAWSLDTVVSYEAALRMEMAKLHLAGRPTSFIIDIRSSGAQPSNVAEALRLMVARLGTLHANRTAVVTTSGVAKLQAKRVADPDAQIFTSMTLARDWIMSEIDPASVTGTVYDVPSAVEAEGPSIHIHGPSDVDIVLTPAAALETAKRIGDAAVEILIETAALAKPAQRVQPLSTPAGRQHPRFRSGDGLQEI